MSGHSATALQRKPAPGSSTERFLSWGRYPKAVHRQVYRPAWNDQLPEILETAAPGSLLPYGLGRSYGDSCLNAGRELVHCRHLNRFLGFDSDAGVLRCESGVTLSDILETFLPRGWFLPVTPGTRFVTVGGAIANDVYGKNQHRAGTFGAHVRQLGLHRSQEGMVYCSPEENSRIFEATVGGLGLTGVIAWADIQLKRVAGPWIESDAVPFRSLQSFLDLSRASDASFEYTMAWIDSFSGRNVRGILFRGNHSEQRGPNLLPKYGPKIPFPLPALTFNRYTVQIFNRLYYHAHAAQRPSVVPWGSFFYPLDSIRQWNLLYGKNGFLQYQCVIPENNLEALVEIFDRIARSCRGTFFTVLKLFGSAPSAGMLSFVRPGVTFTVDFAMHGESTLHLLRSLDEVVCQSGGALYPAKDARMSPALFEASFPKWRSFLTYVDPKMSSSFWRRVTESQ